MPRCTQVSTFLVLSLQLLAVEKPEDRPRFSQLASAVFGLLYCGALRCAALGWAALGRAAATAPAKLPC